MTATPLERSIRRAPQQPGVYLFREAGGRVLYVGKAKSLRARVRSYLQREGDGRAFVRFLGTRAQDVEFIVTQTEQEALLLEDTLIKKFKPPHNVRLKDDKSFLMVKLDDRTAFPRFVPVRQRRERDRGARYFGPYASAGALRRTLRLLHEIVPLRDCRDSVFRGRSRPCIKYEIGRCSAPCVDEVDATTYATYVERAAAILNGDTRAVEEQLEERMRAEAEQLNFETAQRLKLQLEGLRRTVERQEVASERDLDRDAVGIAREGRSVALAVLRFRSGGLQAAHSHVLQSTLPDEELVSAFLSRLYRGDGFVPREILLPCEIHDAEMVASYLSMRRGGNVVLRVAQRGTPRKHVEMAARNAALQLAVGHGVEDAVDQQLADLAQRLGLEEIPRTIDGFDVSAFQGASMVASRVRFVDGQPHKAGYRRFRIRSHVGQDDFASMREVVERALRRDLQEAELPDLIVIDGGKGQLEAALGARAALGLEEIPMISLAKARTERAARVAEVGRSDERIFLPGRTFPIPLPRGSNERRLLERLRDEAHRFAIAYHRKLRERVRSALSDVPGIGPQLEKELLRRFGSLERIAALGEDELAAVPRVTRARARTILEFLRTTTQDSDPGDETR